MCSGSWALLPRSCASTIAGWRAYNRTFLTSGSCAPGTSIAIRSGILEMRDKVIRFFHEMTNEETGEVSAVAVLTAVHLDLKTRKSCPFPEEFLTRGRQMIVEYDPGI